MAHRDRLHAEGTELHRIPDPHLAQVRFAKNAVLPELWLEEAESQPGAVDGHVDLLQREGQAADVILVAMGEKDADHLAVALQQVRDVGKDEVDARHVLLREHQASVDDDDFVLPLEGPHVDAHFAEAAQRQVPEAT